MTVKTPVVRKNSVPQEFHSRKGFVQSFLMSHRSRVCRFLSNIFCVFVDVLAFACLGLRTSSALAAENLFLRKQLGLYVERKKKPRRATDSVRFTLAQLSRFVDWRPILTVVKPDTLIRWHADR